MSTTAPSRASPATLADVIARLRQVQELPRQRRDDLASAVRRIAALLGQRPEDLIADAAMIRQRLLPFTAAAVGMSRGRWRNVRCLLGTALRLAGVHAVRRRLPHTLPEAWRNLLAHIPDRYERCRLSRLAGFCAARDLSPGEVNDTVAAAFGAELLHHGLVERLKQVHREACLAWNRCAQAVPGWPPTRLLVPQNRRDYAFPVSAYPASFGTDLEAYLTHLAGGDLFAETARHPASPITLKNTRLRLLELAAALVHSGRDPSEIRSLAHLISVDAARQALEFFWQRNGKRKTGQLHQFARIIVSVAKHWVKVPANQLAELQHLRKQVDPGHSGMTVRNRARLRQFDDPVNMARLVNLHETIAHRLRSIERPGYNEAVRMQSALALAIVLVAPLRVKNLASLTLDRHLVRARAGAEASLHLVIPAAEVKNGVALEFALPREVRELLDLYMRRFRPLLVTRPSNFLFPARQGGPKTPAQLAAQMQRALKQETGLDLNAHAFRHLCAMLFLKQHPGEYETVRLLLGHKSLTTTVRSYCGLEQSDALRRYDAVLDRYRAREQILDAD